MVCALGDEVRIRAMKLGWRREIGISNIVGSIDGVWLLIRNEGEVI